MAAREACVWVVLVGRRHQRREAGVGRYAAVGPHEGAAVAVAQRPVALEIDGLLAQKSLKSLILQVL